MCSVQGTWLRVQGWVSTGAVRPEESEELALADSVPGVLHGMEGLPPALERLFGVQGSGFGIQGPGSRVQGSGCRVHGSGFRGQGSGCRVQGAGLRVAGFGAPNLLNGDRLITWRRPRTSMPFASLKGWFAIRVINCQVWGWGFGLSIPLASWNGL